MKKVLIVMGSDSDYDLMKPCFDKLKSLRVPFEAAICSAHRTPERAAKLSREAENKGFGVIIAAAGLAAHLPGVFAAGTTLPVIGVPIASGPLNGFDALLAEVQMPTGIPVATVAINGSANAAILATQILALSDPELAQSLKDDRKSMADSVEKKHERLQKKLQTEDL